MLPKIQTKHCYGLEFSCKVRYICIYAWLNISSCIHHISCYVIHLICFHNIIIRLVYYKGSIHISCANKFHKPSICTLFGCRNFIVIYLMLDKIEYCEPQQNKCLAYFLVHLVTCHQQYTSSSGRCGHSYSKALILCAYIHNRLKLNYLMLCHTSISSIFINYHNIPKQWA